MELSLKTGGRKKNQNHNIDKRFGDYLGTTNIISCQKQPEVNGSEVLKNGLKSNFFNNNTNGHKQISIFVMRGSPVRVRPGAL